MKIAVRYYTRSGNTEKIAKAIAEELGVAAVTIDQTLEEKADLLFLGCSYYAFDMDPNVKAFLKENKDKIGKLACFGTSAMMKSMKKPLKKVTNEAGIAVAEEEFHCKGSFGPVNKGRPNEQDLETARKFAADLVNQLQKAE